MKAIPYWSSKSDLHPLNTIWIGVVGESWQCSGEVHDDDVDNDDDLFTLLTCYVPSQVADIR